LGSVRRRLRAKGRLHAERVTALRAGGDRIIRVHVGLALRTGDIGHWVLLINMRRTQRDPSFGDLLSMRQIRCFSVAVGLSARRGARASIFNSRNLVFAFIISLRY